MLRPSTSLVFMLICVLMPRSGAETNPGGTREPAAARAVADSIDGQPVIRSNVSSVSIRDGNVFRANAWRLSPDLRPDTYDVQLMDGEPHRVTFITDVDSISFLVHVDKNYDFVIRFGDELCYQRLTGRRFVPAAVFDDEYIASRRGKILVSVPEAYELVNVAIAITDFGKANANFVYQHSEYYTRVLQWFEPYKDHPFVVSLDSILQRNPGYYATLKMNGNAFVFDKDGTIQRSPIYDRTGFRNQVTNTLLPYFEQMRSFAMTTRFLDFYDRNRGTYEHQISVLRDSIDVRGMESWLQGHFPGTKPYNSYNIVFSPLVAYNQSTTWFENNGFSELQPHVNFPYRRNVQSLLPLSREAEYLDRGSILFTELNHGYINPLSERYGPRIGAAVSNRHVWVDSSQSPGYYRGGAAFTEYMNWGLISLRIVDLVPADEQEKLLQRYERTMVRGRSFPKFRDFNRFLVDAYRNRDEGVTIADMYPEIIEWFTRNNEQR